MKRKGSGQEGFRPKKSLGQNFLIDARVIDRIIDHCDLKADETVLEIGPGQGAITRGLTPKVRQVIAVERDERLVEQLRQEFSSEELVLYSDDFLKFDLTRLPRPIKAIGNLPYYISSPIIGRVIANRDVFSVLFMTAQLEFGERLVAKPGSKDYGALSVMVQLYAETKLLFKIANRSFRPVPKVSSCFIRMAIREVPAAEVKDEKLFERVVRLGFQQRRKSLVNALSRDWPKERVTEILGQIGLKAQVRAEELSITDFAALANRLGGVS